MNLHELGIEISNCNQCSRLREWCTTAKGRNPSYADYDYWGKPVPGFGDPNGRLLIIGLAPGQHGANRTGRPFTGDRAGDWLYSALFRFGFSNLSVVVDRGDGLELKDAYITNVVKCAPPNDKPVGEELQACSPFLIRELDLLKNVEVVLTLGKNSFDRFKAAVKSKGLDTRGMNFSHGATFQLGDGLPTVIATYHSSQRNTNTGRLTEEMWDEIFRKIRRHLVD